MLLLAFDHIQNERESAMYVRIKNRGVARNRPIILYELDGIAQRIEFVFALPQPGVLDRLVFLMTASVCCLVESVGVGVDLEITRLTLNDTAQEPLQMRIVPGKPDIGTNLRRRIAQPHGRNIAGDDKGRAIVQQLDRRFERIEKARTKQGLKVRHIT